MKQIILTLTLVLFTLPMLNAQDLPSYVPTEGLVAYYPFNGNANDESGNGYHGAVNGATLTADRSGNIESAYYFDQSSWIETSDTFSISAQNVSVCAWFYCNNDISSMTAQIISVNTSPSEHSLQLEISANNALYFNALPYGETITPSNTFEYDSWNFVAGTFDGTMETIYLNGQKIIEKNRTGDFSIVNQKINFGRQTFAITDYWYGKIDDVSIWNRALSEQEIQNLYTSSSGDILLNGTVSAENNQIKNVADPTGAQDAATKSYVDLLLIKIKELQDQIDYIMNKDNQTDDDGDGYTEVEGDCDDLNASIRPQVKEVADGIDNNCDGNIDEGYNYTPVIDIDGNSYNYAAYGNQVWTVENAEMLTYRDGTIIPQVTDDTEWANLTTGAWCYHDNDPSNVKLYNWYAIAGVHDNDENTPNKAFAPEGWHVPSDAEWTELADYLIAKGYNYDGTTTDDKIAKAMASTTGWNSSTTTGAPGNDQSTNNSSGFNGFPEGFRIDNGSFNSEGENVVFWSSSNINEEAGFANIANNTSSSSYDNLIGKTWGFSVRFVRN